MGEKIKGFIKHLQEKGIPIFLIRSPGNGPSITFTCLIVSFMLCVMALINTISTAKWFGNIDFDKSLELFMYSAALYFGRGFQKGAVSMTAGSNKEEALK